MTKKTLSTHTLNSLRFNHPKDDGSPNLIEGVHASELQKEYPHVPTKVMFEMIMG